MKKTSGLIKLKLALDVEVPTSKGLLIVFVLLLTILVLSTVPLFT